METKVHPASLKIGESIASYARRHPHWSFFILLKIKVQNEIPQFATFQVVVSPDSGKIIVLEEWDEKLT